MKFIINRELFTKALLNVTKIIQVKSYNPILTNVKLEIKKDGLTILGSSGDISIKTFVPTMLNDIQYIRDISEGAILVNANSLSELIKKLSSDEITFELVDDTLLNVKCNGKYDYKFICIRPEEYADIDFSQDGARIEISVTDFMDAVNQVAFAASLKDARPVLKGVNLESNASNLTFVATDGARLAKKTLNVAIQERLNVTIPAKTLFEIARSITDEKTIECYVSHKKILFLLNNMLVSARLLSDSYPNTKNSFSSTYFYFLEVNGNELISAMERVSLFSLERNNVVKLTMSEDKIEVSSKSQQIGSAVESISNFKYKGDKLEMSFNSEYVKNAIRALKSEDVLISFLGEMKPFIISDKADESIVQLITPVRVY